LHIEKVSFGSIKTQLRIMKAVFQDFQLVAAVDLEVQVRLDIMLLGGLQPHMILFLLGIGDCILIRMLFEVILAIRPADFLFGVSKINESIVNWFN
jgi:hypothetical protein